MKNSKASSSKSRAQVNEMTDGSMNIVGGSVADIFGAFQDNGGYSTPPPTVDLGLMNSMRLLNKKDNLTRSKFLNSFISTVLPASSKDEVVGILSHFVQYYIRGALLDPDWKCRSLYHKSLSLIYKILGRSIESYLPDIYPILMVAMFEDSEVSVSAREAVETIFPTVDRRKRVMVHFMDNLLAFVIFNFDSTPISLSIKFRTVSQGVDDDSFELMDRWNRVQTASIRLVEILAKENDSWDRVIKTNPIRCLSQSSDTSSLTVSLTAIQFSVNLPEEIFNDFFGKIEILKVVDNLFKIVFLTDPSNVLSWSLLTRLVPLMSLTQLGETWSKIEYFFESIEDCRNLGVSFWKIIPKFINKGNSNRIFNILNERYLPIYLNETRSFNEERISAFFEIFFSLVSIDIIRIVFSQFTGQPNEWKLRAAAVMALVYHPAAESLSVEDIGVAAYLILGKGNFKILPKNWKEIEFLLNMNCSFEVLQFVLEGLPMENVSPSLVSRLMDRLKGSPLLPRLLDWVLDMADFPFSVDLVQENLRTGSKFEFVGCHAILNPTAFIDTLEQDETIQNKFLFALSTREVCLRIFEVESNEFKKLIELILSSKKLGSFRTKLLPHLSKPLLEDAWDRFCHLDDSLEIPTFIIDMIDKEWGRREFIDKFQKKYVDLKIIESLFDNDPNMIGKWMFDNELKLEIHHLELFSFLKKSDFFWKIFQSSENVINDEYSIQFLTGSPTIDESVEILRNFNIKYCGPTLERLFKIREKSVDDVIDEMDKLVNELLTDLKSMTNMFLIKFISDHFHLSVLTCERIRNELEKISGNAANSILISLGDDPIIDSLDPSMKHESLEWVTRFNEEAFAVCALKKGEKISTVELTYIDSGPVGDLACSWGPNYVEQIFWRYLFVNMPYANISAKVLTVLKEYGSLEWSLECLSHSNLAVVNLGLARIEATLTCQDFVLVPSLKQLLILESTADITTCLSVWRVFLKKFLEIKSSSFCFMPEFFDETVEVKTDVEELKSTLYNIGEMCILEKEWEDLFGLILRAISPIDAHTWSSGKLSGGEKYCIDSKLSDRLIESEIQVNRFRHDNLKQSFSISSKMLICTYTSHGGEINAELKVVFPSSWPMRLGLVDVSPVVGLSKGKNTRLQLSIQNVFKMNGVQNAIQIWIENIEGFLANVEECYICYSVTYHHGTKGTGTGTGTGGSIPNKECKTCKYKFHSECLLKWFKSSSKSNCPLCTNPF